MEKEKTKKEIIEPAFTGVDPGVAEDEWITIWSADDGDAWESDDSIDDLDADIYSVDEEYF